MAWPFSISTTYIANSLPAIKAADLMLFQTTMNDIHNGIFEVRKALVDDVPMIFFKDPNGKVRWLIDHNGYPMGGLASLDENFNSTTAAYAVPAATGPVSVGDRLVAETSANASIVFLNPNSLYPSPTLKLIPGSANTNFVRLCSNVYTVGYAASSVVVFEIDFATTGADAAINWYLGLGDSVVVPNASNQSAVRMYSLAGGNWFGQVANVADGFPGVGANNVDLGVALGTGANTNVYQRLRIELCGVSSANGISSAEGAANQAKARFFINGVRKATITDDTVAFFPINGVFTFRVEGVCTGAATQAARIGPPRLTWARRQTTQDAL